MYKFIGRILIVMLVLSMVLAAAGCGKGKAVATVNGESITQQQLDQMAGEMKQYYKSQGLDLDANTINSMTLEQLITQTLLLQEAKKMGIKLASGDIDKEIAQYKEQMTEEKFNSFLKDNNISETRLRSMIEKDLIISGLQDKLLEDVKPATGEQAKEYYDKNKSEFVTPVSYQVRHILALIPEDQSDKNKADLEARTKIQAVLEQLKQGKDFSELAGQKSEDPGTASQGGLFVFSPGEAVPEFEQAAKALKPGEFTREPVKTTYGYHIIKMEKVNPEKQKSFDEVKAGLVDKLTNDARQEKVSNFVEEARKKADIVNNLAQPEDKKPGDVESKDGKKE
ncbi:MAG: peptidylprolyl isomerase [Actinobacteria bacterium]|nr:peptidylprolyl isomerase [Actinomycetota bacterium]